MKMAMGPPPPKNPSFSNSNSSIEDTSNPSATTITKKPMGPPPPKFVTPPPPESDSIHNEETKNTITDEVATNLDNTHVVESKLEEKEEEQQQQETFQEPKPKPKPKSIPDSITKESPSVTIPYSIPPWSDAPCHPFSLEVLKDGSIIDQFEVSEKGAYMFGRVDLCDFVLDHPTISRFHAVMQFKQSGEAYIYDLGSTHGTSVNKKEVKKKVYTELHVGDVIRFGHSSRLYVFQGPTELMPPEGDLRKIRNVKIREEMHDREASLLRAKQEASIASGISWGMAEDAIEEAEDDAEEVTWQTYKGQLTDRQQKTREKVIKRMEKVANMKKEIDAIRVKDIPQGGLTQGQQTQIARNEQRMAQILEELESLEETLNESIQESLGARGGKVHSKKKGAVMEDEDEAPSDDDEFYDRTKKPATQKVGEVQSIETADSLLDKKDAIMKEMENKRTLIVEKNRTVPEIESGTEDGDPLDAYMTGLSSQIVLDSTMQLQNDLSSLQSELDRILYLLRIADPSGEAARKRELRVNEPNSSDTAVSTSDSKHLPAERKRRSGSTKLTDDSSPREGGPASITQNAQVLKADKTDKTVIVSNERKTPVVIPVAAKVAGVDSTVTESTESKTPVYTVTKPQWLGAIHDTEMKEVKNQDASLDIDNSDQFVDYKDRKEVLGSAANGQVELGLGGEASGLIIRKRKQIEKPKGSDRTPEVSTSSGEAETTAADAVALLLKHKKGVSITDEEEQNASLGLGTQPRNDNKKTRRVLGPEKPAFLKSNPDYEAWVPPKDQSGDGRTSLNDRFGY